VVIIALGGGLVGYYWGQFRLSPPPVAPLPEDQGLASAPLPPPTPLDQKSEFAPVSPTAPVTPQEVAPYAGASVGWTWTSQRPVTVMDMNRLSPRELELMRNEIYARHGWVFNRADLRAYFEQQPWYSPKGTLANREAANRLVTQEMTSLERQNVRTILNYEKTRQGIR
jgi:hypothetical protein